jgi:hypothetical protein
MSAKSTLLVPLSLTTALALLATAARRSGAGSGGGRSGGSVGGRRSSVGGSGLRVGWGRVSTGRGRSLGDAGDGRTGHDVLEAGVVNVDEDAGVGILVSTGEVSSRAGRDVAGGAARDSHLDAVGIELGFILGLTVLESDDLVTEEVVAVGNAGGDGEASRSACAHVGLEPRSSIGFETLFVHLEPFGGSRRGEILAVSGTLGHVGEYGT